MYYHLGAPYCHMLHKVIDMSAETIINYIIDKLKTFDT